MFDSDGDSAGSVARDGVENLDARSVTDAVAALHRARCQAEGRLLELAAHWADLHHPGPGRFEAHPTRPGGEQVRTPGGPGTPGVMEFAAAELGALQEMTTTAAWRLMADALDLRHRLPRLWSAVTTGRVRVWKARHIATATRHLDPGPAAAVDTALDGLWTALPWTRLQNVLEAKIIEADPAQAEARAQAWEAERFVRAGPATDHGLRTLVARAAAGDVTWFLAMVGRIADILADQGDPDPADVRRAKAVGILAQPAQALHLLQDHHQPDPDHQVDDEDDDEDAGHQSVHLQPPAGFDPRLARPDVVLHIHLAAETLTTGAGAARSQLGPLTLGQVRRLLTGTACRIRLQPVIDLPADLTPADAYEIPTGLRRRIALRCPASTFPYSPTTTGTDLDHTIPYQPPDQGGPPGQTRLDNLGPLSRPEHRLKTHSPWQLRQPEPGTYLWRSPHGHHWITTPHAGTYPLGPGPLARTLWHAADPNHPTRTCPGTAHDATTLAGGSAYD